MQNAFHHPEMRFTLVYPRGWKMENQRSAVGAVSPNQDALVVLSLTACFPNSKRHRTYAKIGEGAAIAGGIGLLYVTNTGADCDQMRGLDGDASGCRGNAKVLGTIGLGLILAGLTGFIATVSTSPEDKPDQPANTLPPTPLTKNSATGAGPTASTP